MSLRRTAYRTLIQPSLKQQSRVTITALPSLRPQLKQPLGTAAAFRSNPFSTSTQIQDRMKAILIKDGKGPAENLYIGEEETPEPKAHEAQIKVKNFGLNRMDILQREGKYPLPPQASKTIMGVEFSGTVTKIGSGVSNYKVGDEVFGLTYGGAYAEYVVCDEGMLLPKSSELSFVEAAAIPENWLTAFQALFVEGSLQKGQNVLIHAGASGVGVAAIQLALHVGGAGKVFTTCGTDEKVKFLEKLAGSSGKLHAFNYRTQDFEEEIKKIDEGVDLVVDFIGQSYFNSNLSILKRDGTMIFLAMMSSPILKADTNLGQVLFKRLTLKGSTLRSRTVEYQKDLLGRFEQEALGLIKKGEMRVEVHEVFPWDKVIEAHKEMEANKNSGKIIFEIPQ